MTTMITFSRFRLEGVCRGGDGGMNTGRMMMPTASPVLFIMTWLLIQSAAWAAGGTSFNALLEPSDPRALALGGAAVSDAGRADAVTLNPAAAGGAGNIYSASFGRHMVDMWSGRLGGQYPVKDKYVIGAYLVTFNYGEMDRTELGRGQTGGTFGASENVLALHAAGHWRRLGWGGAVKFLWGTLDDEGSSGAALDLGLQWNTGWQGLNLGAALRNAGTQSSGYGTETWPLPRELVVGGSRHLQHLPLTIYTAAILSRRGEGDWSADFLPGEPGLSAAIGGEFELTTHATGEPAKLRAGYRSRGEGLRIGHHLDSLAGLSFGLGIPWRRMSFDYAFAPMGALGQIHRFGVSVRR